METKNNEKNILTDEQLKEVAGGAAIITNLYYCYGLSPELCKAKKVCKWTNGKCVNK